MKFKRMLAFVVDWLLSGVPALVGSFFLLEAIEKRGVRPLDVILMLLLVASYPALFVLRDVMFGGRSVAKRMLGLCVKDDRTWEAPSKGKLILRNIFFFVYPIDAIVLLATGRSLGDMATATTVIKQIKQK